MIINSGIICTCCGQCIMIEDITFVRADGYLDWKLNIFCGCGSRLDEQAQLMGRDIWDKHIGASIIRQQLDALKKFQLDFLFDDVTQVTERAKSLEVNNGQ